MSTATHTNVAGGNASVGVQASVVQGNVVHVAGDYKAENDTSPEDTFRRGVRLLDAHIPAKARDVIEQAVADGYETAEVHFYRLLALLTGRTRHQLDSADFDQIDVICDHVRPLDGHDAWHAGLRAIFLLLSSVRRGDTGEVVKAVERLAPRQRDLILRHLGVLQEGSIEDQMWQLSVDQAYIGKASGDRENRVWAFFEPKPTEPRARHARPFSAEPIDWLRALGGGGIFGYACLQVGSSALRSGELSLMLASALAVVGAAVFLVNGSDWYFRIQRVRAKNEQMKAARKDENAPVDGFARGVGRLVDNYFRKYVPKDGTDRESWLEQTAGIRQSIRDELSELYREKRTKHDQIAWLVRHLVSEVRAQWDNGTLLAYQQQWRAPLRVKAACITGFAVVIAAGFWIVPTALTTAPLVGTAWLLISVPSGVFAVMGVFRLDAERRRTRADEKEYWQRLARRQKAYERWVQKLTCKPTDAEMAEWLECDRRILVEETMRYYRLRPDHVIAHAFIEARGGSAKRARVQHGPWRYSRYRMLLFLLTDEGVRQVDIDLDFYAGASQRTQRLTYRYATVTAVRVAGVEGQRQTFELTLFSGEPVTVPVFDPSDGEDTDEDDKGLSRLAFDASGLTQTLDVLEGIAAEGKEWIRRRRNRADERLGDLADAIRDLIE
ncbi:hypothetical protein [Actinoplanes awajinensis]|uniref:Uncharacterized protein n=1 Tax=Actinoplanes awajinensis subsp. mycoplanecinus TaxID=135947 RepID=A0A124G9I3_9ACTN|nr:hypothetical protein [Actinoplanes awajinensis]KUL29185.1 hypothetical protein ADL15_28920 [Actinoplanes awajinensis subsp. mycoplanecinus]